MHKYFFFIFGFLFLRVSLPAQDTSVVRAFVESYRMEQENDFSSAIIAMNDVFDSTSYEMNLRMGWLFYKSGFYERSQQFYLRATEILPSSEEAHLGLALPVAALSNTQILCANYLKILENNNGNTAANYSLGVVYYNNGKYSQAAENFKQILKAYPFNYNALQMMAWTQYKLGNKKEAKEMFIKSMFLSPEDKSAKNGIALLGSSFKGYEKLLNAFSKSYDAFYMEDYASAIKELQKVYDKNSYEINIRLAFLNQLAGLNKESMDYYRVAENLKPESLEPVVGYIVPASAFGQADEVSKCYKRILEKDPDDCDVNFAMGKISFQNKDYQAAKAYFEKVVRLYPFSYNGLIMLAKTNSLLNEKAEAKKLYQRLLLLSPSDKEVIEALKGKK